MQMSEDDARSTEPEEEALPLTEQAEPVAIFPEEEASEPSAESRVRKLARKGIRWGAGLLIVFGLGFLVAIFSLYNPKVRELQRAQSQIEGASATVVSLEGEISTGQTEIEARQSQVEALNSQVGSLQQKIGDLESQIETLQNEHTGFILRITLLKARNEVATAQVRLFEQNAAQARVLLNSTGENLRTIQTLLPEDLQSVVDRLQTRLDLAISELESNTETAISDLNILAGDLLEIENTLFGK